MKAANTHSFHDFFIVFTSCVKYYRKYDNTRVGMLFEIYASCVVFIQGLFMPISLMNSSRFCQVLDGNFQQIL